MSIKLFENVGKELKTLASSIASTIIFTYSLIGLAVAGAGIALAVEADSGLPAVIGILVGIIVGFYGYHKARLQVIALYAYGELVEKVTSLERKYVGSGKPADPRKEGKKIQKKTEKEQTEADEADDANAVYSVARDKDGSWICPFCEQHNPIEAKVCQNKDCGICIDT